MPSQLIHPLCLHNLSILYAFTTYPSSMPLQLIHPLCLHNLSILYALTTYSPENAQLFLIQFTAAYLFSVFFVCLFVCVCLLAVVCFRLIACLCSKLGNASSSSKNSKKDCCLLSWFFLKQIYLFRPLLSNQKSKMKTFYCFCWPR
jgi:hypothetical protein